MPALAEPAGRISRMARDPGEPVIFEGRDADQFLREIAEPPPSGHDERIDAALATFAHRSTERSANDVFGGFSHTTV